MAEVETTAHSFVVKIWAEERDDETGQVRWRGYITHVPSGERRYFEQLELMAAFIEPFLARLGGSSASQAPLVSLQRSTENG